jgi:hypothetical protein
MDVIVLNFVNHRQVENKSGANEDEEHIMCHVLSQATSGQRPAASGKAHNIYYNKDQSQR